MQRCCCLLPSRWPRGSSHSSYTTLLHNRIVTFFSLLHFTNSNIFLRTGSATVPSSRTCRGPFELVWASSGSSRRTICGINKVTRVLLVPQTKSSYKTLYCCTVEVYHSAPIQATNGKTNLMCMNDNKHSRKHSKRRAGKQSTPTKDTQDSSPHSLPSFDRICFRVFPPLQRQQHTTVLTHVCNRKSYGAHTRGLL